MPREVGKQIVVITGASSGIGRETAIRFGGKGASVVLAARNEVGLRDVAAAVEAAGGRALVVPTDVAEREQVERLATAAVGRFGRIDTWVNNAAVSEYALIEEQPVEEIERVLRVNLLGTIYGCKAALPHLTRQRSGTIINVASALAERSIPLQGVYCASKHGVKGFTEALRLELKHTYPDADLHVTLILPAVINTPFYASARSRMGVRPRPIPPLYEPAVVAETIVFAAEHPRRDLYAGGFGKALAVLQSLSPPLTDRMMLLGGALFRLQRGDEPDDGRGNLFAPAPGPSRARGEHTALPFSPYTRLLELHPGRKRLLAAAGVAAAALALLGRRRGRKGDCGVG
jgi:short-subunit dehydrogenase